MHKRILYCAAVLSAWLVAAPPAVQTIDCQVAIIGGGAGGLHTAFRLGPTMHANVCLFEKEDQLGGRVHDVSRTPNGPL
jgi:predicted NAD/FAD-binding protein